MKIGILTYHRANNVGALLQNYALQNVLTLLGHKVETIDYKCSLIEKQNRLFSFRPLKEWIKLILQLRDYIKRERLFNEFRHNYIKQSGCSYDKSNISQVNNEYDSFITGSDQVWNMYLNGEDYTYLLDFVASDKKKIAYAASFGYTKIPLPFLDKTLSCLRQFSSISVRETHAVNLLSAYSLPAYSVLDPTLLLSKNQWEQLVNTKCHDRKFVFVYIVANTPDLIEAARKKAKQLNCELYVMHYNYAQYKDCKNIRAASPLDFLTYLYSAEYVFCSSFHATCFSIIFEKQFYYALDKAVANNNSRLESLCSDLGLLSRNIIYNDESVINYSTINTRLSDFVELSYDYLKKALMK